MRGSDDNEQRVMITALQMHLAHKVVRLVSLPAMFVLKRLGPADMPSLGNVRTTSTDPQQGQADQLVLAELHIPGGTTAMGLEPQRIF